MGLTMKVTLIFCLLLWLAACGGQQVAQLLDTDIEADSKYIYLVTPWIDFTKADRVQALIEARRLIVATLRKEFPPNVVTRNAIDALNSMENKRIAEALELADKWVNAHQDRLNRFGFRPQNFIPSAAIISFGGGGQLQIDNDGLEKTVKREVAEGAAKAGAKTARTAATSSKRIGVAAGGLGLLKNGGSFTIGIVIVPVKVTKIHKITKEVEESWYRFRMSVVGIPDVNIVVQGQKRGKIGLRMGLGFVFGDLQKPQDFSGFSIGYSLNYKYGTRELEHRIDKSDSRLLLGFEDANGNWHDRMGHGLNIKVAALKRSLKGAFQNIYVIASSRLGLQQGSDHEYNAGPVIKLNKIIELLTGQDLSELEAEDKQPPKE